MVRFLHLTVPMIDFLNLTELFIDSFNLTAPSLPLDSFIRLLSHFIDLQKPFKLFFGVC